MWKVHEQCSICYIPHKCDNRDNCDNCDKYRSGLLPSPTRLGMDDLSLAILCERVNKAAPHLSDGRRLLFTVGNIRRPILDQHKRRVA